MADRQGNVVFWMTLAAGVALVITIVVLSVAL